ncbi:MAG: ABC transporter permease [Lachnospiraceae bacterium]
MAQIWEYTKIAIKNIKSNKGRSVLTMLGIIIGISSVIMVMSVGNGVKQKVGSELDNMGNGQIAIYTDDKEGDIRFTQEDFELILKTVPEVKAVTPSLSGVGTAAGPKGDMDIRVSGGNEGMFYALGDPIVSGRYFTADEVSQGKKVAVITEAGAKKLFGTTNVVGLSFEMDLYGLSQDMTIVGLRRDSESNLLTGNTYLSIEVPYTVLGNSFQYYIEDFSMIYVVATSNQHSTQVAKKAVTLLENKYSVRGENMIKVESFTDVASQFNSVMSMITVFISFVAAISLLVGGIGVMNIMLVSVTERTREIGIRKALGARTGSILMQFLAEAGMITLLGGIIGIMLGSLGGALICTLVKVTPSISLSTVLGAAVFSSAVGIFFGIYPAKKAAALSPIEALRYE